jgi:Domain of unknown function (DUF4376)
MSLNEQVIAYLTINNIAYNISDYQTVSDGDGNESIALWNTDSLGAEPTSDQLSSALTIYSLSQQKTSKIKALYSNYQASVQSDVTYTTKSGVTKSFQADFVSQDTLEKATVGYGLLQQVPDGFYWVSSDNTQVPFSLDDLRGLYSVMLSQGQQAFNHLQNLKKSVAEATTVDAVQAIVW